MRRLALRRPIALASLALALLPLLGCHPIVAIEKRMAKHPRAAFKRVNATVAYEITRDNPGILVLDLRRPDEYLGESGHLLHAWNIPLSRLPYRLLDLSPYRDETFLVYCRGGDSCGEEGMRILVASGFDDGILVDGGIERWIKDGYKTVLSLAGAPRGAGAGPAEPPTEPTPPPP